MNFELNTQPYAHGLQVAARLIEYAPERKIALPLHTIFGLIEHPAFVEVPGAASYAYGLLNWQGNWLPLLDLNVLLHAVGGEQCAATPRFALIVAYQPAPHAPLQYGAIGLVSMPQTIAVSDESQCALPEDGARWPHFALSCFQYGDRAIPIVDTARVFAVSHC